MYLWNIMLLWKIMLKLIGREINCSCTYLAPQRFVLALRPLLSLRHFIYKGALILPLFAHLGVSLRYHGYGKVCLSTVGKLQNNRPKIPLDVGDVVVVAENARLYHI